MRMQKVNSNFLFFLKMMQLKKRLTIFTLIPEN